LFRAGLRSYLDIDEFLRFIAVNAMIVNTDSYLGGSHNYYFYLDPKDDRFRFIPWDQDLSMGSRGGNMPPIDILRPWRGDQPLMYWTLDDPAIDARYRAVIKDIAANVFTTDKLFKVIDELEKVQVASTVRGPSPRAFIEARAAHVRQLVAGWK
jgi:hypothetical protein